MGFFPVADVKFDSFDPVSEDAGTVSIGLIRTNSAPNSPKITVKLTLVLGSLSGSDASYTKKEVEFPAGAVTAQFHLTITDDDVSSLQSLARNNVILVSIRFCVRSTGLCKYLYKVPTPFKP